MEKLCSSKWRIKALRIYGHGFAWVHTLGNTGIYIYPFSISNIIVELLPAKIEFIFIFNMLPIKQCLFVFFDNIEVKCLIVCQKGTLRERERPTYRVSLLLYVGSC